MTIHKLVHKWFTACGRSLKFQGGQASIHWEIVDCKRCLTHKKLSKMEKEMKP